MGDTVSISRASSNLYQQQPTYNTTTTYHTVNNILQLLSDKLRLQAEQRHGVQDQAKRGGKVVFQDIAKPTTMEWGSPLDAMQAALELERTVNESLLKLHVAAGNNGDAHLCDFLEANYLDEQVEGIKDIGDMITKLKRVGDGLGVHLFDKDLA